MGADWQVKFAKNGSDVNTAAVRLARAATGRDLVAVCSSQPFFSTDDWFIATTPMNAGIPKSVIDLTVSFPYGDLDALRQMLEAHSGRVAALVMEAEAGGPPPVGYFEGVRRLCDRHGVLLILDEILTGFRWDNRGARWMHSIDADMVTFGKALGNGVPIGALVGRRDLMELGGLRTKRERVFLLSTTFGGDTIGLAAATAVMETYEHEPVVEHLWAFGTRLRNEVDEVVARHGLVDYLGTSGRPCSLVFWTNDQAGQPSQHFRSLFMQELIRHGVLGPSFVDSYAHDDAALDATIAAVDAAAQVYLAALEKGTTEGFLDGPPSKPVFRPYV
jgi:glutamate-1-semialdehyde 2,1-aminomutase